MSNVTTGREELEAELEKTREDMRKQGIDPDLHGVPKSLPEPAAKPTAELVPGPRKVDRALSGDDEVKAELEKARAACAAQGVDLDAKMAADKLESLPPTNPADGIVEALEQAAAELRNAGIADGENQALKTLNDPAFQATITNIQKANAPGPSMLRQKPGA